jgi:CarD family transcriptional regulator
MAPSSRNKPAKAKTVTPSAAKTAAKASAKPAAKVKPAEPAAKRPAAKAAPAKPASAKAAPVKSTPVKPAPAKPPAAKAAAPVKATTSKAPPAKPAAKTTASKPSPVTPKPAPVKAGTTTPAPSSKATLPPVTKSKAPEAKSPVKPSAEKASTAAKVEKPAPAPVAAPPSPEPETAPAAARPAIVVAAPPNMPIRNASNPMSPRPPMGRPNMPPSFAVRSPGRPGFAEGQATPPRPPGPKVEFKAGDHVVYPTHGVGTVQGIEVIEVAGTDHHMIVVTFDENRMTLRVPVNKVPTAGLRKLFTQKEFEAAIDTLKGRARIKRTMWSRRAQEYEAKINSGDPIQIAEVVRDLQRNAGQPDQSFSERQIYEQALERLAAEYAAIEKIDKLTASERLVVFAKST